LDEGRAYGPNPPTTRKMDMPTMYDKRPAMAASAAR
jgi:hypothetical protein